MNNTNDVNNEIYKYVSRKTFFFSLFVVCAFSLLCMLTAISASTKTYPAEPEYIEASALPCSFLVRNIDGYVAICDYFDGTPFEILDVKVCTLPESEQLSLDSGLYITSFSELLSVIEAYTS